MLSKKNIIVINVVLLFCINLYGSNEILDKVDNFRLPFLNAKIYVSFTSFVNNKQTDNKDYLVNYNEKNESLVLLTNSSAKGQRILMKHSGLWFYSPNSQKPIRITPLQRATGEASYGDIASMRYKTSYKLIKIINNTSLPKNSIYNISYKGSVIELQLEGVSSILSYPLIKLWVNATTYQPLLAHFAYASGKISKIAVYGDIDATKNNKTYISSITYINLLDTSKITKSKVKDVIIVDNFPTQYFNIDLFMKAFIK